MGWSPWCSLHAGIERGGERRKRERALGEKERDTCLKNPLLFIFVAPCVHKFLIGWVVMSNLLTLLVRNSHDWVWYENDQYPFFMLWVGVGGGGQIQGGSKPFTCHTLHSRFPFFLGPLPLALSWLQNMKHFCIISPHFSCFPPIQNSPSHPFISQLL